MDAEEEKKLTKNDPNSENSQPDISEEHPKLVIKKRSSPLSKGSSEQSTLEEGAVQSSSDKSETPMIREGSLEESEPEGEPASEGPSAYEQMGTTKIQNRYDQTKHSYETSSKHLQDTVIRTVLNLMQIHKTSAPSVDGRTDSKSLGPMEAVKDLEKEVKAVGRRIAESRREQAFAMSEINALELKVLKEQECSIIRELLDKIPTEQDLIKIARVQNLINERRQLEREIGKLKCGINAMNKAMANVDVVISECSAIKKQRKVVIQTNHTGSAIRSEGCSSDPYNENNQEEDEISRSENSPL